MWILTLDMKKNISSCLNPTAKTSKTFSKIQTAHCAALRACKQIQYGSCLCLQDGKQILIATFIWIFVLCIQLYKQQLQMQRVSRLLALQAGEGLTWAVLLIPKAEICLSVVTFVMYRPGTWAPPAPEQEHGGQPFPTQDVVFWTARPPSHWAEKVQLFFAGGGSGYSIWCCLTQGVLPSLLSVATGASQSWFMLLLSPEKPCGLLKDKKITSWRFIMYILGILL